MNDFIDESAKRQNDGLTVEEGTGAGQINLTSERYRQRAADMKLALSNLNQADPAQRDFATTVALQILGVESTGDSFTDTILKAIQGGDRTDDRYLSVRFSDPDVVGTEAADEITVESDGQIYGVRSGDGADVVTLTADQVFDVDTDANPEMHVSIHTAEGGGNWETRASFANDDKLTINARNTAQINTGGGDDSLKLTAETVYQVQSGSGNDRISVSADYVNAIDAGTGDDIISLSATIANGINGGEGNDHISLRAVQGTIDAGDGDDVITVSARENVTVDGGKGNDLIFVENGGGTVTLKRSAGDDKVALAEGAQLVIQSAPPAEIIRDGDIMQMRFADGGTLTLQGADTAGSIRFSGRMPSELAQLTLPPEGLDKRF
ncbi:calcium-binding protein [Phaeobacter sp. HF9A]|uniref:calcium-binding protein n=1 Tax=Phaeobacter sp. HF9A TaxID=2721561 RepID=UPI0014307335|nr:calcium-binding protein [Phaeobacter sp. HF9A]NIZ14273.1 calcium-binding protein [Phaeobacter sp. HF9A]